VRERSKSSQSDSQSDAHTQEAVRSVRNDPHIGGAFSADVRSGRSVRAGSPSLSQQPETFERFQLAPDRHSQKTDQPSSALTSGEGLTFSRPTDTDSKGNKGKGMTVVPVDRSHRIEWPISFKLDQAQQMQSQLDQSQTERRQQMQTSSRFDGLGFQLNSTT